jgi:predicted O-linked N-acetylglucosamine transferase (SPINDLY family)
LDNGFITFGSFNNFAKVNSALIDVWAQILSVLANSRLAIYAHKGSHRARLLKQLAGHSIAPERIRFVDRQPLEAYLSEYHHIDIALDTFPYAGGTTTCDALWMGVPTVTLCGRTAVGRGGVSILSNVGLPEWVASDLRQYVSIAAAAMNDLPRLAQLRLDLRSRMRNSPLMDATRFAADIESAYRGMWRKWCVTCRS